MLFPKALIRNILISAIVVMVKVRGCIEMYMACVERWLCCVDKCLFLCHASSWVL